MLAILREWLDHRTGYRKVTEVLLIEHIPGGARWRYVWGSCLAFVFLLQLITGVLLMTAYSPSDSTAWSSVYFIQYQMDFGWLIRGLHHFGSQTMVVLLGLHMLQVVIAGAHLPPREINWWLGLALLAAVLGLSLTGYLLPWDQKGYWATQVATNIAGNLPGVGQTLQKIVVGGPVYGHHTLTRFYTLHVAILPPLVIALIIAHLVVFRRHGVTAPRRAEGEGWFWPDQAFRDMLVSLLIFGVMLGLVVYGHGHKVEPAPGATEAPADFYDRLAHAGRDGLGANLDAPADSARPYPARPEWYFLFLFQLLKYFEGKQEIIGTVVIPNAVLLLLFILPLLGYGRMRPVGHVFGVLVVGALLGGVGALTYLAIAADRARDVSPEEVSNLSEGERQQYDKAQEFQKQLRDADALAARAIQLAADGVPAGGAVFLLRQDPLTRGPELFKLHCATCHNYGERFQSDKATASDLHDFGTADWIFGLLTDPSSPKYFGHTKLKTMSNWVKTRRQSAQKKGTEQGLNEEFQRIANWLGGHPRGEVPAETDPSAFAKGYQAFANRCGSCHGYKEAVDTSGGEKVKGPDFTGYGDADWVRLMVMSPASHLRYGARNTMPAFRDLEGVEREVHRLDVQKTRELLLKGLEEEAAPGEKKDGDETTRADKRKHAVEEATRVISLSDVDRELIIRWLVKDYRVVFGGEPISGPPKH